MSSWDNIYSLPGNYGLELITSMDLGESYDFDIYALFRNGDGAWFLVNDSGCSCPAPFEDYTSADQIADGRVFNCAEVMEYLRLCGADKKSFGMIHEFLKEAQAAGLSGENVIPA